MIFVAVGTQLPFDRLIRTVDRWAQSSGEPGVAQIADGTYQPQACAGNGLWQPQTLTGIFAKLI